MRQSGVPSTGSNEIHVAIIMDGNGRWATERGLPRVAGHRAGAAVVRQIVEAAPDTGVGTLTLYAFSSDNWRRPGREVTALMRLFREYLRGETARCVRNGVRLSIVGRRDRLPKVLLTEIERSEKETAAGTRLQLRVAIDYSSRDAILRAAQCLRGDVDPTRENFGRLLAIVDHGPASVPPVDLLIRTGGERRLSDFLLWESAYAELLFLEQMWPEFTPADLAAAVRDFAGRERRFGGLSGAATG